MPPLRDRAEDIRPLAEYFLEDFCRRNNFRPKKIEDDVWTILRAYRWPGNIRELRNVIERMVIMAASECITKESVPLEIRMPPENSVDSSLEETRANAERYRIRQALEEAGGNVSAAARALGIERTRLHKRIRALGIARQFPR
jgi:DNA-binding NtrC family response regulator